MTNLWYNNCNWSDLCTTKLNSHLDSCEGDSGGPLVFPDDNSGGRYVQLGVVSGGVCMDKTKPSIYARLEDESILRFVYENALNLTLPEGKSISTFYL